MAEAIPSRGAHFVIVPLRNDIVIPQQDSVECPSGRLEIGAVLGEDYLFDYGSTAGFLIPIRLGEPGSSAARDPQ